MIPLFPVCVIPNSMDAILVAVPLRYHAVAEVDDQDRIYE